MAVARAVWAGAIAWIRARMLAAPPSPWRWPRRRTAASTRAATAGAAGVLLAGPAFLTLFFVFFFQFAFLELS